MVQNTMKLVQWYHFQVLFLLSELLYLVKIKLSMDEKLQKQLELWHLYSVEVNLMKLGKFDWGH